MYIETIWKSKQFNNNSMVVPICSYSLQHFRSKRQGEDSYADLVGKGIVGQDWHGHLSRQNRRLQVVISTSKLIKTWGICKSKHDPSYLFGKQSWYWMTMYHVSATIIHVWKRPGGGARDCNAATQSEANLAWLSSGAASGLRPLLVNRPECGSSHGPIKRDAPRDGTLVAFPSNEVDLWEKSRLLLRQAEYKNINKLYNGWHPSLPFIPIGSIQSVLECSETGHENLQRRKSYAQGKDLHNHSAAQVLL